MEKKKTFKEVKKIIVEQLNVHEREVIPEAKFIDDLGADSLDLVELVMTLEDRYRIDISDEDAEKLFTVGDVVNYIQKYPASKGSGRDKCRGRNELVSPQIDYSI